MLRVLKFGLALVFLIKEITSQNAPGACFCVPSGQCNAGGTGTPGVPGVPGIPGVPGTDGSGQIVSVLDLTIGTLIFRALVIY